jgi:hypothetical protein
LTSPLLGHGQGEYYFTPSHNLIFVAVHLNASGESGLLSLEGASRPHVHSRKVARPGHPGHQGRWAGLGTDPGRCGMWSKIKIKFAPSACETGSIRLGKAVPGKNKKRCARGFLMLENAIRAIIFCAMVAVGNRCRVFTRRSA